MSSQSTQARVIRLVGEGQRVLELGCATGYMSHVLRDRGCRVVAVEIDRRAAARAAEYCERVVVGDIERIDLARELEGETFDVVVAADVLEHLKDPLRTLRRVGSFLSESGRVVASLPNVAHGSVRLALLTGRFPYGEVGLLDRTHLRFFTRESVEALFGDAGFAITHLERQEAAIGQSEVPFDRDTVPDAVLESLASDPEALTYQFILVAERGPDAGARSPGVDDSAHGTGEEAETEAAERAAMQQVVTKLQRRLDTLKKRQDRMALERDKLLEDLRVSRLDSGRRIRALVDDANRARQEAVGLARAVQERDAQLRRRSEVIWAFGGERARLHGIIRNLDQKHRSAVDEKAELEDRLAVAERERRAARRDVRRLQANRELGDQQRDEMRTLRQTLAVLSDREQTLHQMLREAHQQLLDRDEEFQSLVTDVLRNGRLPWGAARPSGPELAVPSRRLRYQRLVSETREVVEQFVPRDATVIVISKGDPELLKLGSRRAWHLPQTSDGTYAGFHPADSTDAISQLESLRENGGDFLLVPSTSFWWFDYYEGFRRHIEERYAQVATVDEVCRVFDVREQRQGLDEDGAALRSTANGSHPDGKRLRGTVHPLRVIRRIRSRG
jgi:2-polyprenyl-3-methyl-5-hydroxy-6-metoxy-1,4-benzoquinol methylase